MNAMVLSKMEEFEQIGFPNLKSTKRPLEKVEITYENIPTLELARGYPLLSRPTLKVGGFQHWTSLYFKTARFFYLIMVLLVQATQVEAREGHWDSNYLIMFGIAILIAIIIVSVIASLCYCIRRFTGEASTANLSREPETLELALSVQSGYLDVATINTFPERPFRAGDYVDSCSICIVEFNDGEILRGLPNCTHRYHDQCIQTWLTTFKASCPDCRHDYRLRSASAPVRHLSVES